MKNERLDNITREHNPIDGVGTMVNSSDHRKSREKLEDFLFDQYMKQHLIDGFFEDLDEFVEEKDADVMKKALSKYNDAEILSTISLPHQLRKRNFEAFEEAIYTEGQDPEKVMNNFVNRAKVHKFGVGYHTSAADIRPNSETGEWIIKGTENDHRDNDLSKAYYSSKFKHLYKAKDAGFIYAVRTSPEDKTDGNWSRAGTLSVIMRVPFHEVYNYVIQTVRDKVNKKTAEGE